MSMEKRIAILGASQDPNKFGNKAVRAYVKSGYTVYPVNPRADEIEGLKAYPTVLDIPEDVDTASIYLPPRLTLDVLDDLARKGIKEVYFNPGSESEETYAKAESLGMQPIEACSILAVGVSPADL